MSSSRTYEITPEASLNVIFSGPQAQGPTIIFLHFWGGSSRTFAATTSNLSTWFRTIAVDFRGWGTSTGPQIPDGYSIMALAMDVEVLIQKLGIIEVVLVGHSMGGKVAQLVAGRGFVQGLRGLVLLAPAPPTPLILPPDMKEQQLLAYSSVESAGYVVRNVLSSSSLPESTVDMLVEDMLRGNHFAKLAWPSYAMVENILSFSEKIQGPVLVIAGGLDKVETVDRLKSEVLGNIKGAEMVVVENSGHLLPIEAPLQVAEHIKGFIRKLEASSSL